MTKNTLEIKSLVQDFLIVILSIIGAVVLSKSGILKDILSVTYDMAIAGSFLIGIFFTSAFTIAPASVLLAEMAHIHPPLLVAFCGAVGALIGDLIIFLFIRDRVAGDIDFIIRKIKMRKILSFFHLGFLKILSPIIGALIIASPLPDELGLAMMGLSKMRVIVLIPISFVMNFVGILGIIAISNLLG